MRKVRVMISLLCGLLIGLTIGLIVVNVNRSQRKKVNTETTEVLKEIVPEIQTDKTEDIQEATESMTTEPVETQTVLPEEQPEELYSALSRRMVSFDSLKQVGCTQLMMVTSHDSAADIALYTCDEKGLWKDTGVYASGYVGANGVSDTSYEGSKMTPAGVFPVGQAFYIDDKPQTKLDCFQVTDATYWVDDPESDYYNQRVELTEGQKSWNSAEHMIDYYNSYKYGFVINFNMNPVEKGRGSAIFFHIGSGVTLGCVSTSQEKVLEYLKMLDPEKNPYILIQ